MRKHGFGISEPLGVHVAYEYRLQHAFIVGLQFQLRVQMTEFFFGVFLEPIVFSQLALAEERIGCRNNSSQLILVDFRRGNVVQEFPKDFQRRIIRMQFECIGHDLLGVVGPIGFDQQLQQRGGVLNIRRIRLLDKRHQPDRFVTVAQTCRDAVFEGKIVGGFLRQFIVQGFDRGPIGTGAQLPNLQIDGSRIAREAQRDPIDIRFGVGVILIIQVQLRQGGLVFRVAGDIRDCPGF